MKAGGATEPVVLMMNCWPSLVTSNWKSLVVPYCGVPSIRKRGLGSPNCNPPPAGAASGRCGHEHTTASTARRALPPEQNARQATKAFLLPRRPLADLSRPARSYQEDTLRIVARPPARSPQGRSSDKIRQTASSAMPRAAARADALSEFHPVSVRHQCLRRILR